MTCTYCGTSEGIGSDNMCPTCWHAWFAGFSCSGDRRAAVIDAARAHVDDPEVDLPDDWNVPHTPTFAALLDAVRALDGDQ